MKDIDYKSLWLSLKGTLEKIECEGSLLQQTIAQSYLDVMNKLENEQQK